MFKSKIGGMSKGMETWNSFDGTVKTIINVLPQEVTTYNGLQANVMTPINDNTELVISGGWADAYVSAIWKYTYASNSWQQLSNLLIARNGQLAIVI